MVYENPRTGETLGGALREWRAAAELTLGQVSGVTGKSITHLMDVEADKIGPDAELLRVLARMYGSDAKGSLAEAGWNAVMNWLHVFSGLDSPTNREMLDVVAASIRRMRNLPDDGLVYMRDQEADIIFSMLDLTDDGLVGDIQTAFALEGDAARQFIERATVRYERRKSSRQPIIERIGVSNVGDSRSSAA